MHKLAPAFALLLAFNDAANCSEQASDAKWSAWVPSGWQLLASTSGDLNQDSKEDTVLVLEENNPNERSDTITGNTAQRTNYNARRLIILLQDPSGYREAVDTNKFLPSQNDKNNPCSLTMVEGIEIRQEKLAISLHHEFGCGSGTGTDSKFIFRLQNQRFRLIGFDSMHASREINTTLSINYLTGEKIITLDKAEDTTPTIKRAKIPKSKRLFFLDGMEPARCNELSGHFLINQCE